MNFKEKLKKAKCLHVRLDSFQYEEQLKMVTSENIVHYNRSLTGEFVLCNQFEVRRFYGVVGDNEDWYCVTEKFGGEIILESCVGGVERLHGILDWNQIMKMQSIWMLNRQNWMLNEDLRKSFGHKLLQELFPEFC